MTILERLNEDMKSAMKSHDAFTLAVIRMAKGAVQLEAINKKKELTDEDVIDVISKQIKLRKDSISEFEKASRRSIKKLYARTIVWRRN